MADSGVNNLEAEMKAKGASDTSTGFEYLLGLVEELFGKINSKLKLQEDLACADIHTIPDLGGNKYGEMKTYTGSPIDWLVKSWLGNPKMGFTNIHLTAWCDATIDVPHLGFALGTIGPKMFFYVDLIPRYELALNPEHLKYLEALNSIVLALKKDAEIEEFNSQSAFIRSTLSPVALCGLITEDVFRSKVLVHMQKYVDTWLEMVASAEKVDAATTATLQARDYAWRKNLTDLDPANIFADKACGPEMRKRLVRCLQGADRQIPSPVVVQPPQDTTLMLKGLLGAAMAMVAYLAMAK